MTHNDPPDKITHLIWGTAALILALSPITSVRTVVTLLSTHSPTMLCHSPTSTVGGSVTHRTVTGRTTPAVTLGSRSSRRGVAARVTLSNRRVTLSNRKVAARGVLTAVTPASRYFPELEQFLV